ncbi:MAG: hypothetical protein LBT38_07730, partial [Deltaproteobacteria bacterium]|nr:hypothetical protein [Deltaproteobacteria bacterium]
MAFGGQKPKVSDTGDQKLWDLPDPIAEDLARYQKGERLDIPRLLTVAKEIGKSLAIFRPPQGYEPEPIAPELSITPDMARLLGAPSLAEYFRRTLLSQDPHRDLSSRGQCPLPRGPESIPKALRAVEEAILGYRSVDSQAYKKILGELSAIRASLLRAQSLSVELFSLAELFRVESLALRHEAQKLVKAGRKLAIAPEPDDLDSGLRQDAPPLTELTQNLTKTLVDTRSVLLAQKRWRLEIRQVIEEMDSFKAAHLTSKLPIDPVRLKTFDARLMDLENASEVLAAKRQATDERLTRALANLESHESQLVGEANTTVLSYVQTLASSVDTLLKTILARRFDLAEAAWRLPRLVGRPIFLENVYSQTAIFLAQSQGLLEELKSRLNRQVARLSSSREAREAARAALAMDKDKAYPSLAREAQRRLSQLKALRKKELAERAPKTAKAPDKDIRDKTHATHDETYDKPFDWPSDIAKDWPSDAPSDFSAPLTESPPPQVASPAIEYLAEQLNAVALERDRLKDELSSLTERLTESGQTKAKLMKMVESARRELKNSGQEIASLRQQVNDNQEGLRQATLEKEELSKLYDQTIKDYNNLTSAANQRNEEFQNIWADRELLAKKRADLEISLANLDHEKRALEAKGQELAISLDQARGQETALATELAGHQEELAEATRARQRLGQVITAYRGQLDRLAMANQALRQAWLGRGQALKRGEKEKVGHKALLARREKAIIRQVARRRELLDELSQFRARLESMEAERTRLNQEIEAARAEAERARNETLQLEAESQEFRKEAEERLAQSQELRKEAEELLAENQEFRKAAEERLAESQEFRKKAEARLAQAQSEALAKEERLKKELGDLQKEMDQSLKPLIELLGLALWQGEAQARQASQTAANNVIKLQKEAAAREAGLRVRGAGREIDLLERLARREKDLEALKAEIENMEMEKTASLEAGQNQTQSWVVNQLSVALAASDLRHEHLNRGLRDLKARFSSQRSEAQSVKTEMEELIQNQAQALARHQAWLSELVPLVAFFLDSGLDFWTHSPATGDTRQAVLFFLRQENAALTEELANVRSERQGLIAERQSLLVNQEGIK